ncbi:MAG: hypothetical protein ACE5I7_12755 [Candidatus Binatia bacterium]
MRNRRLRHRGRLSHRIHWAAAGRVVAGIAVALVVTFASTEVMLRLLRHHNHFFKALLYSPADPIPYDGLDSVDALLSAAPFHPKPFHIWFGYKLNSHGFRTPEYTREKPAGIYRIVALGDSFASDSGGVPVDQLWHNLVGQRVHARTGRQVEVINLGVPGVGPRFSLRLFDLEGRHLAPDLVLLSLFVGNDLTDERASSGLLAELERSSLAVRLATHVVTLIRSAREVRAERRRQIAWYGSTAGTAPGGYPVPGYVYDPEVAFVSRQEFLRIEWRRSRIFATSLQGQVNKWIDDVVATVVALDRAVRAARARLLVVIVPDVVQVDASVRRMVVEADSRRGHAYDFNWIQSAITTRLASAGVAYLDVLPAFQAAPASPRLYRRHETHWSAAGNALAARQIAAFLARRGIP